MINPPPSNDVNRIADWIELYILSFNTSLSKAKITSCLEDYGVNVDEQDIDSAFQELERRLDLYGLIKPFKIVANNISPNFNWKKYPEFALCLYYSTYGAGKAKKDTKKDGGTKLFEEITLNCLIAYLQASGHTFGFPNKLSFKKQLDDFALKINSKRFDDPNPTDKDRGVDIVIYRQLDKSRSNCLLLFVQCAAGNNWSEKKVVSIESYNRFMQFSPKSTVSSIAITQVVSIDNWNNMCDDYGLIIDRPRLFRMFTSAKNVIPTNLTKDIITWYKAKLN